MSSFEALEPQYEERVRSSFSRQSLMNTIQARMTQVAPGTVEIEMPYGEAFGQQLGFVHGAIITAIADSACGYAALTLTAPGSEVLTVEFKANFLAPAEGEAFVAKARVLRQGRSVTVCSADVFALGGADEPLIATMLATMKVMSDQQHK
ncbi:MAG: PaaI family thioesterase [Blastocatellia bacterium]